MRPLPRYVHIDGLPANESLEHFTLKWAAYRLLTHELGCPFALVEAGARAGVPGAPRSGWPRHDALGVRFRSARSPMPWTEVPAEGVRLEVLDGATGRWRPVGPDALGPAADPTLRGFQRTAAGEIPLRAVAPGKAAGQVRIRGSGGVRRELAELCAADAKQSRGDLQAWLRDAPRRLRAVQLFVLVAPVGLCRVEELPPRVGLAEVDLRQLLDARGEPAIRMLRAPQALRPAQGWEPGRAEEFQRHAYYAMHGLFGRRLFWLLAQQALQRRAAAGGPVAPGDPAPAREAAAAAEPARGAVVRSFAPADRAGVAELWARTGIARAWNDPGAEIDLHQRRDAQLLLVAEDPAAPGIIGAVMGGWDGRRGWMHHLAIDTAWRRRGLGRALVEEVERRLAALGCRKVLLMVREDNLELLDFYTALGYAREDARLLSRWLVPPS